VPQSRLHRALASLAIVVCGLSVGAFGVAPVDLTGQVANEIAIPEGSSVLIGFAIDSTTGAPLSGAAIYVVESEASAVSDSLGRFALGPLASGLYRVSFYHQRLNELDVSAAPLFLVDLTAGGISRADLYVPRGAELEKLQGEDLPEVEPIMLEAIEVVAERAQQREVNENRIRSGANVSTMEREQIDRRVTEARHIGDLITGFTSLRVTSPGGGVLCVESRRSATLRASRRGKCSQPVAVYLDGVHMSEPEYSLMQIRPQDIERVEFVNGLAAGARYGRNSANGVLLIETRRPH
jgi:hypothetical protein